MSCACQLINYMLAKLQLKKMFVMYESAHAAITFQLHEMSYISQHPTKQFRIFAQGTFFKGFFREDIGDFTDLHNEKKSIWKFRVNGIVLVTGTCVNTY